MIGMHVLGACNHGTTRVPFLSGSGRGPKGSPAGAKQLCPLRINEGLSDVSLNQHDASKSRLLRLPQIPRGLFAVASTIAEPDVHAECSPTIALPFGIRPTWPTRCCNMGGCGWWLVKDAAAAQPSLLQLHPCRPSQHR